MICKTTCITLIIHILVENEINWYCVNLPALIFPPPGVTDIMAEEFECRKSKSVEMLGITINHKNGILSNSLQIVCLVVQKAAFLLQLKKYCKNLFQAQPLSD